MSSSLPDGSGPGSLGGWILMEEGAVPPSWRPRARMLAVVPLLPGEMRGVLRDGWTEPELEPSEIELARLVARGTPIAHIARELGKPLRTVQRQLARLRRRLGFETTRDLAAFLATRGF